MDNWKKEIIMRKLTKLIVGMTLLCSCQKGNLDSVAFPGEHLDSYEFENYNDGELGISDPYAVTADKRTLVSMTSTDKSTGEEYTIFGVYIGDIATIATDTVIMYCHGQALHMDYYWTRATLLANIVEKYNYGVFMMDYRGYGMSTGASSEQGLYEDVDASIDWLIDHGVSPENTIYYGFSLGCIPVIDRALYRTDFKPSKIIIESPLASVANLTQRSLILNVDPAFVSTLVFDNAEKMKDISMPLQWWHGVEDDYIAIQNGELIYNNHKGIYKEAIRVEGANHGDIPTVFGYQNYIDRLENFIERE